MLLAASSKDDEDEDEELAARIAARFAGALLAGGDRKCRKWARAASPSRGGKRAVEMARVPAEAARRSACRDS